MYPAESAVARPRFGHAEVWVESPLQLLSAIEAHGAGLLGTTSRIHPRGGTTTLDATLATLIAQAPAGVQFAPSTAAPPAPGSAGARRWVIGDAYSGRVQRAMLGYIAVKEVVIIDDGLATLGLIKALVSAEPTPLVRPRSRTNPARRALGIASWYRLRALARAGRLLIFTALPVEPDIAQRFLELGGHLESHRFEWLNTQPVTERINEPTVVVGSAMAADGLIHAEPYFRWLDSLTLDGPVAYFPHRRESGSSWPCSRTTTESWSASTPSPSKCDCARCAPARSCGPCRPLPCRPCGCCWARAGCGSWAKGSPPPGGNPPPPQNFVPTCPRPWSC